MSDEEALTIEQRLEKMEKTIGLIWDKVRFSGCNGLSKYEFEQAMEKELAPMKSFGEGLAKGLRGY